MGTRRPRDFLVRLGTGTGRVDVAVVVALEERVREGVLEVRVRVGKEEEDEERGGDEVDGRLLDALGLSSE